MALKNDEMVRKQREAAVEWSGWLATLDDRQKELLRKYTLLDENNLPTIVTLGRKDKKVEETKIGLDAIKKLLSADTTKDHMWTDWLLYQSGGGDDGKRGSADGLETVKKRFIDERTKGYMHAKKRQFIPGISKQEAESKWEKNLPEVKRIIDVGDEDAIAKLHCFGYARTWPGFENRYSNVYEAVVPFLKLYKKLMQMNTEQGRDGRETLPFEPDKIKNFRDMEGITKKVSKYFGSKAAREDIRVDQDKPIYDDDVITALVPLTYAAAVRYGFDEWAWANRERFEKALASDDTFSDEWRKNTERGTVYVYFTFNVPVPSWIVRQNNKFERRYLRNLALVTSRDKLRSLRPDSLVFHDEENNENRTLADIKQMILNEPVRPDDPDEEEYPFKRGARVYKTHEEAENVVSHLDLAVDATVKWAKSFDPKRIKSNTTELDIA